MPRETSTEEHRRRRGAAPRLASLALLLLALTVPAGAGAQSAGPRVTMTDFAIPTANSLPGGLAVGPDGALWFFETGANKLGRMTLDGRVTEYPIPTPDSTLPRQGFLGVGPDRALWFTETRANKIGRLTTGGDLSRYPLPTPGSVPYQIVTGPDGALWFTQMDGNRIGRAQLAEVAAATRLPRSGDAAASIGLALAAFLLIGGVRLRRRAGVSVRSSSAIARAGR